MNFEMNFEMNFKRHYFLFTSSSSLCAFLGIFFLGGCFVIWKEGCGKELLKQYFSSAFNFLALLPNLFFLFLVFLFVCCILPFLFVCLFWNSAPRVLWLPFLFWIWDSLPEFKPQFPDSWVRNIWFLSPLVLSKWENLALYTFWGKCVYFSILEW